MVHNINQILQITFFEKKRKKLKILMYNKSVKSVYHLNPDLDPFFSADPGTGSASNSNGSQALKPSLYFSIGIF